MLTFSLNNSSLVNRCWVIEIAWFLINLNLEILQFLYSFGHTVFVLYVYKFVWDCHVLLNKKNCICGVSSFVFNLFHILFLFAVVIGILPSLEYNTSDMLWLVSRALLSLQSSQKSDFHVECIINQVVAASGSQAYIAITTWLIWHFELHPLQYYQRKIL